MLVLNSTFASSAPSGISEDIMEHFHISQEVAVLCISLFVAGYCVGPLLWGPLSESFGRRPCFVLAFIVYTGFQVGCALAPNTGAMLAFRFLSGTFAAAPLTNSGALLADIWDVDTRGTAMAFFSLAPFAGPSLGPIVSGYIQTAGANWRWLYWTTTIFAGVCTVFVVFTLPETYAPIILKRKAQRLRKETGDERWYAPIERRPRDIKTRLKDILLKPFIMLALEPMLMAVTLYMSFVYGIVYLLFEAYPFVFVKNHGFNAGENGLAFLGFFTGGVLATIFFMTVIERRYQAHARRIAPDPVPPEKRLEMCAVTGWLLVIAMFWFGWTSYASIHWISPVLAGALIGVSALGMFLSLFNHIIDSYLWSAASALSACTVVRSAFGAGFPLFASQMYERLGTQWASSLLGFIALVLAPVPLVLMKIGPKLRARSRFTPSL
jgi:multidrug resistance protein